MSKASKPIFYTGGGVINSGPKASELLREVVSLTGFPITSTLQVLELFREMTTNFWECLVCMDLTKQTMQCIIVT